MKKLHLLLALLALSFLFAACSDNDDYKIVEDIKISATADAGLQEFTSIHVNLGNITVDGVKYELVSEENLKDPDFKYPAKYLMTHLNVYTDKDGWFGRQVVDTIYGDWFKISFDMESMILDNLFEGTAKQKIEYKANHTSQPRKIEMQTTVGYDIHRTTFTQEGKK